MVIRQNLAGADYALIDQNTMTPNPDYWASLVWKQYMGTQVLKASGGDENARLYAHCAATDEPGAVSLVAINLDLKDVLVLDLGSLNTTGAKSSSLTASALTSAEVQLNGRTLVTDETGTPPALEQKSTSSFEVQPHGILFVELPQASFSACEEG